MLINKYDNYFVVSAFQTQIHREALPAHIFKCWRETQTSQVVQKKSNFISVHCLFLRILFAFSKRKNSRQYDPSAPKNIFDYRILFQILPNVIPQIHSPSIQMLSIVFCLFHNQFREQRELATCEKWKYWWQLLLPSQAINQSHKKPVSASAMLTGKFLYIRKVFATSSLLAEEFPDTLQYKISR